MESKSRSIEYRDPELEHSFSFSNCHDFNSSSSLAIFSDNDDADDADDDYIEIALEPAHFHHNNGGDGGEECCDGEMELRISFSSCVPHPAVKTTTDLYESATSSTSSLSSSSLSSTTFSFRSSSGDSQRNPPEESKPIIESKPINRFVNTLISSFRVSSGVDLRNGRSTETNHLELVPSSNSRRKSSEIATTTINSSNFMMKFFIKFRALKLRKLLASFLKASQSSSLSIDKGKLCEETFLTYNRSLTKPMDKGSAEKKQGVLEMNSDAIRGVLEAISITSLGRRDRRRTKSCPVSTKSSPIHQRFLTESYKISANDNSIQAAIAHCKKSFNPNA